MIDKCLCHINLNISALTNLKSADNELLPLMFVVTAYDNFACLPRDDLSFFDVLRAGGRGRGGYQYLVPLAPCF